MCAILSTVALGIAVNIITGDQRAIAIEMYHQLEMPTDILDISSFNKAPPLGVDLA